MMYRVVSEKPEISEAGEWVVEPLSFLEEVRACHKYRPANGILAHNYLRSIAVEVGRKYDKSFNAFKHIVPTDYVGIATHTEEDVARVVRMMFNKYPSIYSSYVRTKIKDAPFNLKCIIWVGDEQDFVPIAEEMGLKPFSEEAIQMPEVVEVEDVKPAQKKPKKSK